MWTTPTKADFKARFSRDFPWPPAEAPQNLDYVIDADLDTAMGIADATFNQELGAPEAQMTEMYLLLAAFFLVENLKSSSKGIAGQAEFMVNSKSVGGVSVSSQIPEEYTSNPMLAQYTANRYGMQYITMVYPHLIGGVALAPGATTDA